MRIPSAPLRDQKDALRQQLTDNAPPPGAQAEPHRHLAPARGSPREQQIRGVSAGDRQNEAHHRQQQIERLGVLTPEAVEAAGPVREAQHGEIGAFVIVGRGRGHPVREGPYECSLGLLEGNAGSQPSHHLDPVVIRVAVRAPGPWVEAKTQTGVHGEIHLRRGRRIDAEEP